MLIDKWLDPQIRYILNQLTKMHVNIRLPDMGNLIDNEVETLNNLSNEFNELLKDNSQKIDEDTIESLDKKERERGLDKSASSFGKKVVNSVSTWEVVAEEGSKHLSKQLANPFETLATLMNQSNIINISLETLNVKIPMLFSADINAYEMYLKQRLEFKK